MTKVQIAELRNHVSEYVRRAEGGETIRILRREREVAKLGPSGARRPRGKSLLGYLRGTARVRGDLVRGTIPPREWFRT